MPAVLFAKQITNRKKGEKCCDLPPLLVDLQAYGDAIVFLVRRYRYGSTHTDAVPREIRAVVAATRAHTDDAAMIMVVRHFDVRYYGRDTREATMLLRWC